MFLLEHRAILKSGTTVSGNLGVQVAGGRLRLGGGATFMRGTQAVADGVVFGPRVEVFDVVANSLFGNLELATIIGTTTQPVPLPVYFSEPLVVPDPFDPANFPSAFPITCGGPAKFGAVGEGFTLPPGSYSDVVVGHQGKLTLGPGTYNFCVLKAVRATIEVTGPVTLNVRDRLKLGAQTRLEPVGNVRPSEVQVNLEGTYPVNVGYDAIFRARLFAPHALLRIGSGALVTGHFVASELRSDPGFTAPQCGDGALACGETCDPPGLPAVAQGNLCRRDCTFCGDGIVQPGEVCDGGSLNNTVAVDFQFAATAALEAFQIQAAYPPAKGSFMGTGVAVSCTTDSAAILGKNNDQDNSTLNLIMVGIDADGSVSNLGFPINVHCLFDVAAGQTLSAGDIAVTTREVVQNGAPGDTNALLVRVGVSAADGCRNDCTGGSITPQTPTPVVRTPTPTFTPTPTPGVACGDTQPPQCGGTCPPNQQCLVSGESQGCECLLPPPPSGGLPTPTPTRTPPQPGCAAVLLSMTVNATYPRGPKQVFPFGTLNYSDPATVLVMPFDVTETKLSYQIVSRTDASDPDSPDVVATHWSYWSEDGLHRADVFICLTQQDTVVVDPVALPFNQIQVGSENVNPTGGVIDLSGHRGFLTVSTYQADPNSDICRPLDAQVPLERPTIVGGWTIGSLINTGAIGSSAVGWSEFPDPGVFNREFGPNAGIAIQTINPEVLGHSRIILIGLEEGAGYGQYRDVEIGPIRGRLPDRNAAVCCNTEFNDNLETRTSLPDVCFNGVGFESIAENAADPGDAPIIPGFISISSPGTVRLTDCETVQDPVDGSVGTIGTGEFRQFIVGFHGQTIP